MPKIDSGEVLIGIDPGALGGIAVLRDNTTIVAPMPDTLADLYTLLNDTNLDGGLHRIVKRFASVELVTGYVGGPGNTGSSQFKFGKNVGAVLGILTALGIPFEEVAPRTWQKSLSVSPKGKMESRTEFKNRLKAKAQQLFPGISITLKTADAVLIAEHCRRKRAGAL